MLDILRDYISDHASADYLALMEVVFATFERIELQDYERQYEEILMLADDDELNADADPITQIDQLTRRLLANILREHGVELTPEATVDFAEKLVTALLDLQNREDVSSLLALLAMQGSAEEVFAELMAEFLPMVSDEILLHLHEVSPFVIVRIREFLEAQVTEVAISADVSVHQQQLQKLCEAAGVGLNTLRITQLSLPLGLPMATYIEAYGRDLDQVSVQQATLDLMAAAAASSDRYLSPVSGVEAHIDQCISNLDSITRITIAANELLVKTNR